MSCLHPLDTAVLADYWLAALSRSEEEAVEEHLFTCDECGARLRELIALVEAVRNLARQGSLLMVVSDAFIKRVEKEGLRVREYTPPIGGSIACTVAAEDDFLIGRLTADLRGAKRVDLCMCDERGTERFAWRIFPLIPQLPALPFSNLLTMRSQLLRTQ